MKHPSRAMRLGGSSQALTQTTTAAFAHPQLVREKFHGPQPFDPRCNTPQEIAKSSSFLPAFNCTVTHLGCLPRPDHVSAGSWGFRYLGNTCGYGRRSAFDPRAPAGALAWSRAKRRSSSSFSAVIFAVSQLGDFAVKCPKFFDGHCFEAAGVHLRAPVFRDCVLQISVWRIQKKKWLYFESARIVPNRGEEPSFFLRNMCWFIRGTYRLSMKVN